MCVLNVGSLEMLLASALHGAAQLGCREDVLTQVLAMRDAARDVGGHRRMRSLLRFLMSAGVPLLVATGMRKRKDVEVRYSGIHANFVAGSLLLLADDNRNVLGLALPVGKPVYVPEGERGFLPGELRHSLDGPGNEPLTCLEMWVRVVCVADYERFCKDAWWRGPAMEVEFNWALDRVKVDGQGARKMQTCNATATLPNVSPLCLLFPTLLSTLGKFVGHDYKDKLASLRDPPGRVKTSGKRGVAIASEEEKLADPAFMLQYWRRAVLLHAVLDKCDDDDRAHATLRGALPLPACILDGWRGVMGQQLPAALPVCYQLFEPGMTTAAVMEVVRCVRPQRRAVSWYRKPVSIHAALQAALLDA